MKRALDLLLCAIITPPLTPVLLGVAALVKLTSKGPVLYWSDRVGRENTIF